jgi:hypothetical protein
MLYEIKRGFDPIDLIGNGHLHQGDTLFQIIRGQ